MRHRAALARILDHVRGEPSRTWSIIITLYGDAIVPRGGCVWLGTLLAFFDAIGISGGVVRTAMSRLASDGWLERHRVSRNSYYRLAEKGKETFRQATEHIYHLRPPRWRGHYELLLPDAGMEREPMRTILHEAGFGEPAPGMWIAPAGASIPHAASGVLRLHASGDSDTHRTLAARGWPLEATAHAYRRFMAAFEPLRAALDAGPPSTDRDALVARVLLIHEYRRIVLRDPILPIEILPESWPGSAARSLCAEIYARVLEGSERWLDENATDETGGALPSAREIYKRFKG
ncbi:phenylacetic acid degradation operon negative regulatory protein PaaX [Pendulispora rubella]|uniref:Phenylacetic acid degradation operon negative regulatory protein PaaX n=1 Tax=Pendulispora rubella TaxID=2741070 RepID=A0ABZ2L6V6_9BACT